MSNEFLNKSKRDKKDEFYTLYEDVEKELQHYDFTNKIVYCNCDTAESNFVKYLQTRNVKELIYTSNDFRDNIDLLKRADIITTNPPFSLFREYVKFLVDNDKKFIILGNINTMTTNDLFPLIRDNKVWLGCSIHCGGITFKVPYDYPATNKFFKIAPDGQKYFRLRNVRWLTNIQNPLPFRPLPPTNPLSHYLTYDNYDAININSISQIPLEHEGVMGVPITFLDYYDPKRFRIVGKLNNPFVEGKEIYKRILIQKIR